LPAICSFSSNLSRNTASDLDSGLQPEVRGAVNCPESLPLTQPDMDPNISAIKRFFTRGKFIVKTYKSGISNVWKNQKQVRALRKEYNFKSVPELQQRILDDAWTQKLELGTNPGYHMIPGSSHITRRQYILTYRTAKDFYKLPLFAIVFAICFEMTPLVLILFPKIAPGTCTIKETHSIEVKNKLIQQWKQGIKDSDRQLILPTSSIYKIPKGQLEHLFNLLTPGIVRANFYTLNYIQSKLVQHIQHIKCDDLLLSRFDGAATLDYRELLHACQQRAIITAGKTKNELQVELSSWIKQFSQTGLDAGFLFTFEKIPVDN
jgi:pentamidine resistance factor, mitochondrial